MTPGSIARAGLWIATFEGPYHVDPNDPGGATAFGIALRYHAKEFTDAQLRVITVTEAAHFLASSYMPDAAEQLPDFLATPMLAYSVLEGPLHAVHELQSALGVKVDGMIGPQTAAAAAAMKPKALLTAYFRECMRRLHASDGWRLDGLGWECRQFAASLEGMAP